MPARSFPDTPSFSTRSEHDVWRRMVKQLGDDCIVLPNLRISDAHKDHEVDLLVLMPGSGIVVVEVKGSHVWHTGAVWQIIRDGQPQQIDPVGQARDSVYALRNYVESDPRWTKGRLRWSWHVVLAHTELDDDFATPDCPRWSISGSNDLATLGERVWDTTDLHRQDATVPSRDHVELVREILAGRNHPARDVVAEAEDRQAVADRLTDEQSALLGVTRLLNRVEVRGGAGSGKTVLAIRQARDLARGRFGERQRVAVVCYSYGLGQYLSRALGVGPHKERPAFVGTFEDLAVSWGITIDAGRNQSDFWEVELPRLMTEAARGLADGQKFDSIIVDEAQDFADDWWSPLLQSLRDEQSGGLFAYSDERQRVFARFGRPPVRLIPLVLDHNLRNTRQIAVTFASLAPSAMQLRGGDGPEVSFVPCRTEEALAAGDDEVEALLDEGWEPRDIALIAMGSRHPVQAERQESMGQRGYWGQYWDNDDVFYGHVLGFKGMERRAVVLCVNDAGHHERSAEKLYVGLSRATDRLVVVGDPDVVREIGGDEVAQQLGCV